MRQKAIVDSIKAAAANLQDVSAVVKKYPDTKVDNVHVSDSSGYVTIVVRVRVPDAIVVPILSPSLITHIKTENVADNLGMVIVPPLPPVVIEIDTIASLSPLLFVKLNIADIQTVKTNAVIVPPLPPVPIEPDTILRLAVRAFSKINTQDISLVILHPVTVPPLPEVLPEFEAMALPATVKLRIREITSRALAMVTVPDPPPVVTGIIDWLNPRGMVTFVIGCPILNKAHITIVPDLEEKKIPVEEMHLSDEGYSLLEKMEGFSPELYSLNDGGFTIGFGFFVPYGEATKWNKGVTWEDAERMIRQKVPAYEDQVKQYINVPLTQLEFDALTMLAYNLGGFSKATSIVNDVNSNTDFEQLQKDWMRFVHSKAPGVLKGLMNRRKDEMHVRSEADYQPERKVQILKTRR